MMENKSETPLFLVIQSYRKFDIVMGIVEKWMSTVPYWILVPLLIDDYIMYCNLNRNCLNSLWLSDMWNRMLQSLNICMLLSISISPVLVRIASKQLFFIQSFPAGTLRQSYQSSVLHILMPHCRQTSCAVGQLHDLSFPHSACHVSQTPFFYVFWTAEICSVFQVGY